MLDRQRQRDLCLAAPLQPLQPPHSHESSHLQYASSNVNAHNLTMVLLDFWEQLPAGKTPDHLAYTHY
jgi:hypothetical protein